MKTAAVFTPFANLGGSLSFVAAFEQMLLYNAFWNNRLDVVQGILDILGGGSIVASRHDFATLPPSWLITRQGNDLYITITGTVNAQQWIGNISGVISSPYPPFTNQAHSFFADSWTSVSPQIRAAMPSDYLACRLHFVGFSYGAAVAWLLALEYLQATPSQYVDYLGMGGPKSLTSGYTGPLPAPAFMLGDVGDVFPYVPPNGVLAVAFSVANAWRFSVPSSWRHYTRNYLFDSSTGLTSLENGRWDSTPDPQVAAMTYARHDSYVYLTGLQRIFNDNRTGEVADALNRIAVGLISGLPVQLPAVVNNPNASANLPAANSALFLGQDGGVLTPNNTQTIETISAELVSVAVTGAILSGVIGSLSMSVKATFFFRDGLGNGFSESWYRSGDLGGIQPTTITQNYLNRRMAISGTNTDFIKARFSQIPANRIVTNVFPGDLNGLVPTTGTFSGAGHGDEGSDISNTSLNIEKRGGVHTGRMYLRGLPDLVVSKGGQYVPIANYGTLLRNFFTYMSGASWMYQAEDVVQSATSRILSVAPNVGGNGSIVLTLEDPIFDPTPPPGQLNTNVNGSISGMVWNKNLNGPLVVRVTGAATCESIRPIAMSTYRQPPNPKFKANYGILYALTSLQVQRAGHRKAGRPFAISAGRVKNRARG